MSVPKKYASKYLVMLSNFGNTHMCGPGLVNFYAYLPGLGRVGLRVARVGLLILCRNTWVKKLGFFVEFIST